jgi:1-deoxy-D-xylulose-5-phosphate synthase
MIVSAPKDENELQHLLFTAINSGRPFALRYPRGFGIGVQLDPQLQQIPIGKGEFIRRGSDITLFAYGSMVKVAMDAAAALAERDVDAGVVNARFAKPLDQDLVEQALNTAPRLLTLEEHLANGGFGSAVLEFAEKARVDRGVIRVHAIPDQFIEHGPQAYQRAKFHLDVPGVVDTVLELFPELAQQSAQPRTRRRVAAQKETITW